MAKLALGGGAGQAFRQLENITRPLPAGVSRPPFGMAEDRRRLGEMSEASRKRMPGVLGLFMRDAARRGREERDAGPKLGREQQTKLDEMMHAFRTTYVNEAQRSLRTLWLTDGEEYAPQHWSRVARTGWFRDELLYNRPELRALHGKIRKLGYDPFAGGDVAIDTWLDFETQPRGQRGPTGKIEWGGA